MNNKSLAQVFFCELCGIFQSSYFTEYLRTTTFIVRPNHLPNFHFKDGGNYATSTKTKILNIYWETLHLQNSTKWFQKKH